MYPHQKVRRASQLPQHLRDVALLSPTGSRNSGNNHDENPESFYRRVYFDVVDRILSELASVSTILERY